MIIVQIGKNFSWMYAVINRVPFRWFRRDQEISSAAISSEVSSTANSWLDEASG